MSENKLKQESSAPVIGEEQIALLEQLSNACAISGNEKEVRSIVLEQVKPLADELKIDSIGNVLVTRRASPETQNPLRVMLAAHMDEVGFMIVNDENDGFYRFEIVGGIDERQLISKPVLVGAEHLPGIIGSSPIHLVEKDELERKLPIKNMRVDLGPGGADKTKPGDMVAFATRFQQVGPSLVGKALDDRIGVATLIELVKHPPANVELLAAFTVQEELGLRGAGVAAYTLNPDLAIVLDCTPAYDFPHWEDDVENTRYNTRLGAGPAIYTSDRATISDPRLVKHMIETAHELKIPYQLRQAGLGGTDAGAIHRQRTGIPSVSVSVPARYAHTPVMIARFADWQHSVELVYWSIARLHRDVLTR